MTGLCLHLPGVWPSCSLWHTRPPSSRLSRTTGTHTPANQGPRAEEPLAGSDSSCYRALFFQGTPDTQAGRAPSARPGAQLSSEAAVGTARPARCDRPLWFRRIQAASAASVPRGGVLNTGPEREDGRGAAPQPASGAAPAGCGVTGGRGGKALGVMVSGARRTLAPEASLWGEQRRFFHLRNCLGLVPCLGGGERSGKPVSSPDAQAASGVRWSQQPSFPNSPRARFSGSLFLRISKPNAAFSQTISSPSS